MARSFAIPDFYRSSYIRTIKMHRQATDPRKKDLTPSLLDFGPLRFKIARHFGFCFGVENAIEIAYRAIEENPGKKIYLLSEMIHNPEVNNDLLSRGVRFLMDTSGERLINFSELGPENIVIVPAFGTTIELCKELAERGIDPDFYDTTCPFVEKVWKRSNDLGEQQYTVVIHGKKTHEETRATFSHSKETAPTLVVRDMPETELLADFITGKLPTCDFSKFFGDAVTTDFNPEIHLSRLGVVNQTTMLASETAAIALRIKAALAERYGEDNISQHFADTRDTLCYATQENQSATTALMSCGAELAIVVGGYNSSNTSHLVELLEQAMPTYYVCGEQEILNETNIRHFCLDKKQILETSNWLLKTPLTIAITSGASCPDTTVDRVIRKVTSLIPGCCSAEDALKPFIV